MKYQIGQKIYNRGDMANRPGWFEITEIINNPYCTGYNLKEVNGERETKAIFESQISEVDKGHSGTRFVTEKAYKEFKKKQIKAPEESFEKYRRKPQAV